MTQTTPQELANLKTAFATKGHDLTITRRAEDGSVGFMLTRWTHSRHFNHLHDLQAFLVQIGGSNNGS